MASRNLEQIISKLGEFHKKLKKEQSRVLEEYDISLIEYHIIMLADKTDEISQNDIADALDVDKALISRQIQNMEKKGLLISEYDPECRRRKILSISPKSKEILPKLKAAHKKSLDKVFSKIDKDRLDEFGSVLEELVNRL